MCTRELEDGIRVRGMLPNGHGTQLRGQRRGCSTSSSSGLGAFVFRIHEFLRRDDTSHRCREKILARYASLHIVISKSH
nr:hypothetical protein CFP56_19565 [Quercus suber]